jgi:hypothetical protein
MMTKALESRLGALSTARPTLGYLIKVKFANKPRPLLQGAVIRARKKKKTKKQLFPKKKGGRSKIPPQPATTTITPQTSTPNIQGTMEGLYIYRLPHGMTVADATANNGGASVHLYIQKTTTLLRLLRQI